MKISPPISLPSRPGTTSAWPRSRRSASGCRASPRSPPARTSTWRTSTAEASPPSSASSTGRQAQHRRPRHPRARPRHVARRVGRAELVAQQGGRAVPRCCGRRPHHPGVQHRQPLEAPRHQRHERVHRDLEHAYTQDGGRRSSTATSPRTAASSSPPASTRSCSPSGARLGVESQEATVDAILSDQIKPGDVIVVRYEGPAGGPGMQEMLYPTAFLKGAGLGKVCALITDGRFSGGSSGR